MLKVFCKASIKKFVKHGPNFGPVCRARICTPDDSVTLLGAMEDYTVCNNLPIVAIDKTNPKEYKSI